MIGAGSVPVHLLQQNEIRIHAVDNIPRSADRCRHALLILSPGGFPPVHEKAVIGPVCPEADIVGHNKIRLFRGEYLPALKVRTSTVSYHLQGQFVRKSLICGKYINDIGSEQEQEQYGKNPCPFQHFFHLILPFAVRRHHIIIIFIIAKGKLCVNYLQLTSSTA